MRTRSEYAFEVCANSVESCIAAEKGGADRVELCASIPEGGTTPSLGEMVQARRRIGIRLHVIIRPRGGDFIYSPLEVATMADDIRAAIMAGADGLVFGCLDTAGEVDMAAMRRLLAVADGKPITFHRAFDRCCNPQRALEQIAELGIARILTSGQQPTAPEGAELLRRLQMQSAGRVRIMAGCGVNETNISQLAEATGIREFHFSARERVESAARHFNGSVAMGAADADERSRLVTTSRRVRDTIAALIGNI